MSKSISKSILLLSLLIVSFIFSFTAFAATSDACIAAPNCNAAQCSGWDCESAGPPGECDGWCSCEGLLEYIDSGECTPN
jgi:hypothetical protein